MEKRLVKTGIYVFLIGMLLGIVFIKDTEVIRYDGSSLVETIQLPLRTYLLKLIRFSSAASLAAMFAVWVASIFRNGKSTSAGFLKTYFKGFAAGLLLIFIILLAVSLISRWGGSI